MDTTSRVTKSLTNVASIDYPSDASVNVTLPSGYSLTLPNFLIKSLCVVGFLSAAYHAKGAAKFMWSTTTSLFRRISRLFAEKSRGGTAVIYGAANKIGKAFALHFAKDSLNLVLIDYSPEKLNKLKEKLIELNEELEEKIICCVLNRVSTLEEMQNDSGLRTIYQILNKQKDIEYFVNCRSVKQNDAELFHYHKSSHVVLMSYYNMTVYATLLRKVLKIMSKNLKGNIICLNTTYGQEHILRKTHPLFFASTQFVSTLAHTLKLTYKEFGINFLNVNDNYRNVTNGKKYSDLVKYALRSVGISDNIYI